jgi:glycosyltransferase involved in cell wall biosynthesis
MSHTLVSVIMPSFKMGQFIGEALESVGAQTYPHWEVIVVDDAGPDDGTRAAVEAFAAKHPRHRVEYIRHQVNRGVSAARNTAIKAAKGEWLAFLDPDDLWKPEHVLTGLVCLQEQPEVCVTSASVQALREGREEQFEQWIHRGWTRERFPISMGCENFIVISSTLARKVSVDAVGGFCEDKEIQHIEDYDLWVRLILAGMQFTFIEKVTCCYRIHGGGASFDPRRMDALRARLMSRHAGFFLDAQGRLTAYLATKMQSQDKLMGSFLLRRLAAWSSKISSAIASFRINHFQV